MSKFDTHGGYFSPKGYFKVNEGGSHAENPNGGVQIGVDPEGVPNMLEEGEPVYNDYVYSDNIKATVSSLKNHGIPEKYAGKLYSEIADIFVDEAAERPNDPVSNNGLNAMLVRLADAQEEQKMKKQQKELEDELAQLSPEELAELEQMLSQPEMVQPQENPEEVVPEMVQQPVESEQPVPQMQQPAMPMMANGGLLKTFGGGGPAGSGRSGTRTSRYDDATTAEIVMDALAPGYLDVKQGNIREGLRRAATGLYDTYLADGPATLMAAPAVGPIRAARAGKRAKIAENAMEKAYKAEKAVEKTAEAAGKTATDAAEKLGWKGGWKMLYDPSWAARRYAHDHPDAKTWKKYAVMAAGSIPAVEAYGQALNGVMAGVQLGKDISSARKTTPVAGSDPFADFAEGGELNLFVDGGDTDPWRTAVGSPFGAWANRDTYRGPYRMQDASANTTVRRRATSGPSAQYPIYKNWDEFLAGLGSYGVSRNPGGVQGTYRIDSRFPLAGYKDIKGLEADPRYQAFTNYVISNPSDPNVIKYLKALDAGVAPGVTTLYDGDALRDGWQDIFRNRRNDGKAGIYHFSGNDLGFFDSITNTKKPTPTVSEPEGFWQTLRDLEEDQKVKDYNAGEEALKELNSLDIALDPTDVSVDKETGKAQALPTWPRYAGALMNGAMAIYNAFQEPDKYKLPRYSPVLPSGRMDLIDPSFRPLDQNMAVNDVLSSSAGTTRALQNSGLGPSLAGTLLAQDYNTGRNIGTALESVWEANNRERNNIIAARNQNASALGNFNYGQSRDRANILNQAALHNNQNDLYLQRLNYAAEAEKYAALQSQLDSIAQALAGIGRENFAMNQLNSNTAFNYGVTPYGWGYYQGYKCGGKLKK